MKPAASAHTSSERGVVGWFRRLFGGKASTQPLEKPANTNASAPKASALASADVSDAWSEHTPGLAPHARALGLTFQLPEPLSDAQLAQVQQLVAAVMEAASGSEDAVPSSLPSAALRMLNLAARSDVEVAELASAINQDAALTAAVLRVASSAAQGAGEVNTVRDAVVRLGVTESARVAAAVAAKTLFSARSKQAFALFEGMFNELNVAAMSAAGGAAYLSMERSTGRSDLAYLGGMLHDVGRSLGLSVLATLTLADRAPRDLDPQVLQQVLEEVHVPLGTLAIERWALPAYLLELCASHHDTRVPDSASETHLVRVVSGLILLRARPQPLERLYELEQSLEVLRMTPLQTRALDAELRRRATQVRLALGSTSQH
ncbi:MAG TPA: HDOD domain-containing protein [Polyangiales bacterium]|nr:HDOD domain-containing protein [Polyangiales bacterium]